MVPAHAGEGTRGAVLEALQQLPGLAASALAHAVDYLRSFNSEGVLQQCASFRPFQDARSMALSPNALQQLEVALISRGQLQLQITALDNAEAV